MRDPAAVELSTVAGLTTLGRPCKSQSHTLGSLLACDLALQAVEEAARRCKISSGGVSHLLRSINVPRMDLEVSLRALVDGCDPHPQEEIGARGVDEPLRQQPVAVPDVEEPAVDGGQQGYHPCADPMELALEGPLRRTHEYMRTCTQPMLGVTQVLLQVRYVLQWYPRACTTHNIAV